MSHFCCLFINFGTNILFLKVNYQILMNATRNTDLYTTCRIKNYDKHFNLKGVIRC